MHAPVAREFLKRGIHVICDKPLTATLAEAKRLQKAAAEVGRALHPHPQLHRLPDDPAGPRDGRRRASSASSAWCRWSTPRTGSPTPVEQIGLEAGRLAHRPGAVGRRRRHRRHRHPRLQPRRLRHRPAARVAGGRPAALRPRPPARRQRPTCSCATRAARAACSGAARWRPATRTRCACASTARRAGSSGSRRSRTTSGSRRSASRSGSSPAAAPAPTPTPRGSAAPRAAIPEGYLEGFANIYAEAARAIRARRERPAGAEGGDLSHASRTASPASPSSRPA